MKGDTIKGLSNLFRRMIFISPPKANPVDLHATHLLLDYVPDSPVQDMVPMPICAEAPS
jgi:hypothetical protein